MEFDDQQKPLKSLDEQYKIDEILLLTEALNYVKIGWKIFPVWGVKNGKCLCRKSHADNPQNIGKHPIFEKGFYTATTDPEIIKKWWKEHPCANIAAACGAVNGIAALDVDPRHGGDMSLLNYAEILNCVKAISGSGGEHYIFKYNYLIKNTTGEFGPGLDTKSDGGYILLAPSNHASGRKYEWILGQSPFDIPLTEAPSWIFKDVKKQKEDDFFRSGERNSKLTSIAGRMRREGIEETEIKLILLEINKKKCQPILSDSEITTIAKSVARYNPQEKNLPSTKGNKLAQLVKIMEEDEILKNIFTYNLFTHDLEYTMQPPWSVLGKLGQSLTDNDLIEIKYYISRDHNFEVSKETIIEGIIIMARQNAYHPVCNFLNGLKWDGQRRLDQWLITYCQCPDTSYIRAISRKTLVAAIARVFDPGCKFDFMLILEGRQGIGKSQLVKALGGKWFLDTEIKERDKDTIDKMRGAWIIEISELVGIKRAEIESLKAFISRESDRERLPYKRTSEDFPRQCIFIGTHNPSGDNTYFFDETGNRRFWPALCLKADYEGIRLVREQLFAEAKTYWEQGEKMYLENIEDEKIAITEQEERVVKDPWFYIIHEYVSNREMVTGKELLLYAIKMPIERQSKESLMKIGRIMRELNWDKKRESTGKREWYYRKPDENSWEE